jgi:hypothetical protein
MGSKIKIVLVIVLLVLAGGIVWQIAGCAIANTQLKDDLRDMASQLGARVGAAAPQRHDELRDEVVHKAEKYDIHLESGQVTVCRSGNAESPTIYLAADYECAVRFPGFTFQLHFNPTSER